MTRCILCWNQGLAPSLGHHHRQRERGIHESKRGEGGEGPETEERQERERRRREGATGDGGEARRRRRRQGLAACRQTMRRDLRQRRHEEDREERCCDVRGTVANLSGAPPLTGLYSTCRIPSSGRFDRPAIIWTTLRWTTPQGPLLFGPPCIGPPRN